MSNKKRELRVNIKSLLYPVNAFCIFYTRNLVTKYILTSVDLILFHKVSILVKLSENHVKCTFSPSVFFKQFCSEKLISWLYSRLRCVTRLVLLHFLNSRHSCTKSLFQLQEITKTNLPGSQKRGSLLEHWQPRSRQHCWELDVSCQSAAKTRVPEWGYCFIPANQPHRCQGGWWTRGWHAVESTCSD